MNDTASPTIALRAVDTDHLVSIEDNHEAIEFGVRLSSTPSEVWISEFEQIYHNTPYTLKPPVRAEGDALRIVFLHRYASEVQGFLQFLALIIDRANVETRRTEELHLSSTQEQYKAEFRETLRQVKLPVPLLLAAALLLCLPGSGAAQATPTAAAQQVQVDGIVSGAVDTLWKQTDVLWHRGDYPRIVALDRIITQADPQFLEAYATGGWLMDSLGRTQDAEAFYTLGTRSNPAAEYAFWNLGFFYFNTTHNYAAAARSFRSAVQQRDADLNDWKMLAHSYEKAGQWDNAVSTWQQTQARYPHGLSVDRLLAEAEQKRRLALTGRKPAP